MTLNDFVCKLPSPFFLIDPNVQKSTLNTKKYLMHVIYWKCIDHVKVRNINEWCGGDMVFWVSFSRKGFIGAKNRILDLRKSDFLIPVQICTPGFTLITAIISRK